MGSIGGSESGITSKMALCLAAITLVGIDGEFKEEELNKLRELIKADETSFLAAFTFYNEHPLDVCIKTVTAKLNEGQKKVAYGILHDLAYADFELQKSEEDLLQRYGREFRLKKEFLEFPTGSVDHAYDLSLFKD
jgi:uncharacterized tellurite resistance protein B-like protein